eukprot:6150027-Amphidinium_carterae.1
MAHDDAGGVSEEVQSDVNLALARRSCYVEKWLTECPLNAGAQQALWLAREFSTSLFFQGLCSGLAVSVACVLATTLRLALPQLQNYDYELLSSYFATRPLQAEMHVTLHV